MLISNRLCIGAMVGCSLFAATIIGVIVHGGSGNDGRQLRMLHIVMRHGIRTPASTYPNDPYINETFFPYGWGQLTNQGKLELYETGKYLRKRYGHFLGTIYNRFEYHTQTTDVDRTKTTAQVVNAGLWPPDPIQKWGPMNWQPIPVHTEPLQLDSLLLVRRPCPQYHIEMERVVKTVGKVKVKFEQNRGLFEELTLITGQKTKNFDDVQDIYSTLRAEESYNLTLPEWTKDYYPHRMYEPTIFSYVLNTYTPKLKRLKGGVFLKKLISDWTAKAEGRMVPPKRKAFLYAGHDSTIANILGALGVWDPQMPEYGVTALFELLEDTDTNQFGVKVFYRNSTEHAPHLLTIPGCDSFCPLDKLVELTSDVIPEDWDAECDANGENYSALPPVGP